MDRDESYRQRSGISRLQFSIQTIGTVDSSETAAGWDFEKKDVTSPVSVSIKSSLSGPSPETINRAEDLMSIRALAENVQVIDVGLCFCQLVGLSEKSSVVVLVGCSTRNGTQLWAANPTKRHSEHGPGDGSRVSK